MQDLKHLYGSNDNESSDSDMLPIRNYLTCRTINF